MRPSAPALLAALLLGALLSGCAAQTGRTGTDGSAPLPLGACLPQAQAIPFGGAHDHRDPAQHRLACNATMLAHDDLRRFGWDNETVVGAHVADVSGTLLAIGVNAGETKDGQQGFHLFDVSDPARLVHLAYWKTGYVGGDRTVVFSGDGKTVFVGYEKASRSGVAAVDVRDPANPTEVAFWSDPEGYGSHTISAGVMGGTQYVFALALGVNVLKYDAGGFTLVGKYATNDQLSAAGAATSKTGPTAYAFRSLYGHDMTFYADPTEGGRPLLFVAYAYDGLKILDLTVPSAPTLLGRWLPPADTGSAHYTHSVAVERAADGKLLLVVGSETFEPENQGIASPLWLLDATQTVKGPLGLGAVSGLGPDPVLLGTWRNPSNAPAGNLGLSVHFFRLEKGLLYVSHYHGGVWAIDLRSDGARRAPAAFGYAMPVPPQAVRAPEQCCIGFDLGGVPMVFDVAVHDGVVYAADETQGVTALRFTGP
ncbi:MAG TPA: hypothetical protein VM241_02335 [Candidatus Thermoplasmatota archaeon]|nr:hypothetical protein [Candidatus Thermoplasmatota archaeon]